MPTAYQVEFHLNMARSAFECSCKRMQEGDAYCWGIYQDIAAKHYRIARELKNSAAA